MRKLLSIAMVACAIPLAACGGTGGMEEAAPADELTIVFENQMTDDAIIYYLSDSGINRRLGRVHGTSTEEFRARTAPTGFTIVAEFDTMGEMVSDVIRADAGEIVTVTAMSVGGLIHTIRR